MNKRQYFYGNQYAPVNTKVFKKRVFNLTHGEFKVLGKYINCSTKIKMKHMKCGHILYIRPNDFINKGYRCHYCDYKKLGKSNRKTTQQFKKQVSKLSNNQYIVLGKYKTAHTKIKLKHKKCGHVFYMEPVKFTSVGERCPYCYHLGASKGENILKSILDDHFITYKYGYRLYTSKYYYRQLHLDFYIPSYRIGIEYDGYQHFAPVEYFGGKINFNNIHHRDKLKDQYCKKHNIDLIRIENINNYSNVYNIRKLICKTLNNKFYKLLESKTYSKLKEILEMSKRPKHRKKSAVKRKKRRQRRKCKENAIKLGLISPTVLQKK